MVVVIVVNTIVWSFSALLSGWRNGWLQLVQAAAVPARAAERSWEDRAAPKSCPSQQKGTENWKSIRKSRSLYIITTGILPIFCTVENQNPCTDIGCVRRKSESSGPKNQNPTHHDVQQQSLARIEEEEGCQVMVKWLGFSVLLQGSFVRSHPLW